MSAGKKRVYRELSIAEKKDLFECKDKNPKITLAELGEKYGISKSSVGNILKNEKCMRRPMKIPMFMIFLNLFFALGVPI